jgi:tetratricopeptide (TPR) repeat protein
MTVRPATAYPFLCCVGLCALLPTTSQAYINAGFRSQQDYDKYLAYEKQAHQALAAFSAAIQRDPRDPVAYYQRARVWEQLPEYAGPWPDNKREDRWDRTLRALSDYNQAIRLDASFTKAYLRRAAVLWTRGEYENAWTDLRQAAQLEPRWPLVHAQLALAYADCPEVKFQDLSRARAHAQQACQLSDQRDLSALQIMAHICAVNRDFPGAVRWQTRAVAQLTELPEESRAAQRLRAYQRCELPAFKLTFAELEQGARERQPPR